MSEKHDSEPPTDSGKESLSQPNQQGTAEEKNKNDIPADLRHALEDFRKVSYEDEDKKVVSVRSGESTYSFFFDRPDGRYVMRIYDNSGNLMDSIELEHDADTNFLDELFKRDIPVGLRQALEESREVFTDHRGEEAVRVKYGDRTYEFHRAIGYEYASWLMVIRDQDGKEINTTEIREDADADYLEDLFNRPTKKDQMKAIKDKLHPKS